MATLIIVLAIAAIFYLFIPGIGAFHSRRGWRLFRKRIIAASQFPFVSYRDIHSVNKDCIGHFRFLGNLQAMAGEHLIWLGDGRLTLSADLKNVVVHLLPSEQSPSEMNSGSDAGGYAGSLLPDETVRSVRWETLSSLPEGTRFFVAGPLFNDNGRAVFRSTTETPLVVVISDWTDRELLPVAIWMGRQRNEYWNRMTPASLAVGFLWQMILSYSYLREPLQRIPAIFSLTTSLAPLAIFLPPGLLFFSLYRYFWKKGRVSRGERDIALLPLRYFGNMPVSDAGKRGTLPDGGTYSVAVFRSREEALGAVETAEDVSVPDITCKSGNRNEIQWFLFGEKKESGLFAAPRDPMAELCLFAGNPLELSRKCALRARKMELLSAASFALAFGINTFLLLYILARIIR